MTNQSFVHRYTNPATSGDLAFCAVCAEKQRAPLIKHEPTTITCQICERKYEGIWLRWRRELAQQDSPISPPPSIDVLKTLADDAKLSYDKISLEHGDLDTYIIFQETRRVAYPCLRHDLVNERSGMSQWRPALAACKWFMPAFITGAELDHWSQLLRCPDDERETKFESLMHEMYTPRRQVRSLCTYHDRAEFKPFRRAIIDALKAAHFGLYYASTPTLVAVVEGVLRAMEATLGLSPVRNEARALIARVFEAAHRKMRAYSGFGIDPIHWIPEDYTSLEFLARLHHKFLSHLLFKDFLLTQLFAKTEDVASDQQGTISPRIINRPAIMHGLTPPRGIALDTIKLLGVLDGLAQIIGYVTDQGFTLYGVLDGARDANGGVVHEPGSSIDAVTGLLAMLGATKDGPNWTAVDGRASQILESIAVSGTVIRPPVNGT